jgi:hypothetical protein
MEKQLQGLVKPQGRVLISEEITMENLKKSLSISLSLFFLYVGLENFLSQSCDAFMKG